MKFKQFLLKSINLYQKRPNWLKKRRCVFYPTCSDYAVQAIEKYGSFTGLILATKRILRCHPWQKNHMDPLV